MPIQPKKPPQQVIDVEPQMPSLVEGTLRFFESLSTSRKVQFRLERNDESVDCGFCTEPTPFVLHFKSPGRSGMMTLCKDCCREIGGLQHG